MKFFLKIVLWLVTIVIIGSVAASFIIGYEGSMSRLISFLHEELRAGKILALVTVSKFLLLQIILLIAGLALLLLLFKFNSSWEFLLKRFRSFKESWGQVFRDMLQPDVRLIFVLPFAGYIFFAFYLPVAYDEASTYLNFTSHSPLVSMLYYPAPNNHILHSVITSFTKYIPLLGPLQCMRISS